MGVVTIHHPLPTLVPVAVADLFSGFERTLFPQEESIPTKIKVKSTSGMLGFIDMGQIERVGKIIFRRPTFNPTAGLAYVSYFEMQFHPRFVGKFRDR